jgi:RimJ/RimL family protein N-acetyltransferase
VRKAKEWPDGPLVFGRDEQIAKFVQARIPNMERGFGMCAAIGVIRRNKLVGGIVYHEYRPELKTIMVSMAGEGFWMTPSVLTSFFAYPFEQLGCNRIWLMTAKRNKRTRRFVEGIGFKLEGCMRRGFLTDDLMIYGVLARECRWLEKEENGQIGSIAAGAD